MTPGRQSRRAGNDERPRPSFRQDGATRCNTRGGGRKRNAVSECADIEAVMFTDLLRKPVEQCVMVSGVFEQELPNMDHLVTKRSQQRHCVPVGRLTGPEYELAFFVVAVAVPARRSDDLKCHVI